VTIRQENSLIGAATGAILGGLAGSELGGGDKAQTAGGVAGAVLGGIAGNEAGKALGTKPGLAITVDFGKDEIREIVQPADVSVRIGQIVDVAFRADGVFITPVY
ncbi:MAG: glycine zipper 2TM domain-containing protein, partial [Henriciella sp.]